MYTVTPFVRAKFINFARTAAALLLISPVLAQQPVAELSNQPKAKLIQKRLNPLASIPVEPTAQAVKTPAKTAKKLSIDQNKTSGQPTGFLDEIGPHHRIWSTTTTSPTGNKTGHVTEIASGMHYWDGNSWQVSNPSFELREGSFQVGKVQHKIRLSANLNQTDAVSITTPDGQLLHSTPIAIGLFDAATGRSQILAGIGNCAGTLVSSNRIVYPNAFNENGVSADVVYTVEKGSFEQDIVIRSRLDVTAYGFPKETTRLQVYTEFFDPPKPERLKRPVAIEQDEKIRAKMSAPDLMDEVLGFGELTLGTGRAYTTASNPLSENAAPVGKELKQVSDRSILVESVDYRLLQVELDNLPTYPNSLSPFKSKTGATLQPKAFQQLPRPGRIPLQAVEPSSQILAQNSSASTHGVVLDYVATIGPSITTPTVFQRDTTYFVSGPVNCNGVTTLEAAVFKFPNSTGANPVNAYVKFNNTITVKTAIYSPAIFTSADDDSVGDSMNGVWSGYTGSISGRFYANPAIWIYFSSTMAANNIRVSYAQEAVRFEGPTGSNATLSHAQFFSCMRGIVLNGCGTGTGSGILLTLNNALMTGVQYPFTANFPAITTGYFCTIDSPTKLITSTSGTGNFTFYNSVFAHVPSPLYTGTVNLAGSYNGFDTTSTLFGNSGTRWTTSTPFQTGDLGAHYLNDASGFRAKGTTSIIPSALLTALKQRTTHPPVSVPLKTEVPDDQVFSPRVARYVSGATDLGYHYDALDYTMAHLRLNEGIMTILPGTAIAFRSEYDNEVGDWSTTGIEAWEGSTIIARGLPTAPIVFVGIELVQEASAGIYGLASFVPWYDPVDSPDMYMHEGPPAMDFRFANFYLPPESYHFGAGYNEDQSGGFSDTSAAYFNLRDCNVMGGRINFGKQPETSFLVPGGFRWVNNLFERVDINIDPDYVDQGDSTLFTDMDFQAYNNLFRNSRIRLVPIASNYGVWTFKDNFFDKVAFVQATSLPISHDYNGYWKRTSTELTAGQTDRLVANNSDGSTDAVNDKVLTTAPAYLSGTYGAYYLAASGLLYNGGSRTPAQAGMYHYTTRTDNTKDGDESASPNMVNIGIHYVAANSSGLPKDSESPTPDGVPDYVEDANGNNTQDSGESSLTASDAASDSDGDGISNLQEYQAGSDLSRHRFDLDGDGLSFSAEYRFGSSPFNAHTSSGTFSDAEYHLGAVKGQSGTRVSLTQDSSSYDAATARTTLEFTVAGAYGDEFHEFYIYDTVGAFWKSIAWELLSSDAAGDHYRAIAAGNQGSASFAALNFDDEDLDGIPDGYEMKVTHTQIGDSDSNSNGIVDGDEDPDADTLTIAQERLYGTNPFVLDSFTDTDGDGLPDWFERYIRLRTGLADAAPWTDSDGDGVPDIVEFEIGSDPVTPDFGSSFHPFNDFASEFATMEYTVSYGSSDGPAGNPYFPSSGLMSGAEGLSVALAVQVSNPSGAGTATVRLDIAPLAQFYDYVWPFTDDGSPDQGEVQKPDPLDGAAYRNILVQATSLSRSTWSKMNAPALQALRSKTLEYLSAVSMMKISYYSRTIQHLEHLSTSSKQFPGIFTRIKACTSIVHTEMTKLTAIHIVYVNKYPNLNYVSKVLKAVNWMAFGATALDNYQSLRDAWDGYRSDVANHTDTAGPALLSVTVQQFITSIPGMPNWVNILFGSSTAPFFDPCPLGAYDGGGGCP